MKIALIKPPGDFIKVGLGAKTAGKHGHLPPLGLAFLASALEKEGHRPIIIDAPAQQLSPAKIESALRDFSPDAIGISLQILDSNSGLILADRLKTSFNVPLLLGGPHVTSSYREIISRVTPPAYLILGEGEKTLPSLIKAISENQPPPSIPGVLFLNPEGKLTGMPDPISTPNIDDYPAPAYHLYLKNKYHPLPSYSRQLPATTMITSRGCPYQKCTFCFQGRQHSAPYRRHSPGRITAEIEDLVGKWGIKEIIFVDDIFTINNDWIETFCRNIIESKIGISWVCYGKADLINRGMLGWMKRAGCYQIKFGFESGNQNLLDSVEKGFTLNQVRNATRLCQEIGLEVNASFILGLPGETPELGRQTIRWALELDPDFAEFFPCHPSRTQKYLIRPGKTAGSLPSPMKRASMNPLLSPPVIPTRKPSGI